MSRVATRRDSLSERYIQYFSNVFLLSLALTLYSTNKYYIKLLDPKALLVLEIYVAGYVIIGFFFYTFFLKKIKHETIGCIVLRALSRVLRQLAAYLSEFTRNPKAALPTLEPQEKTALLFTLVKLFYLPLMANFCVLNFDSVMVNYSRINHISPSELLSIVNFNNLIYPFFFFILIFVDTLFFTFGYMFEADFLKNRVRSVEPTFFGWMVTLACYPPFNDLVGSYLNWPASDFPAGSNEYATFAMRLAGLVLFGVYVWATLALGTKASNLTNRGIVSRGPYAFVRHPAYISKNMAWWLSMLPALNFFGVLNMLAWSFIYFLRAITEERHLIKDPDYQQYCSRVHYRFIPYVW